MKQKSILLTLGFFLCFWVQIEAQTNAIVIRVVDGDTYQLLKNKNVFTVRLANIDAPETKQRFGEAAKDSVSKLIFGKTVWIDSIGKDRYNRVIANMTIMGMALDSLMVRNGWAWHYVEYSTKKVLANYQEMAINEHLGLWKCGANKVCPPSVFRSLNAKNKAKYCNACNN
jgi:endonuclease YncB( thermonuclease family)